MDKLFSALPFKTYLCLPCTMLAAYATRLWVFNKHLKSISADSRPKYLACIVSLLSQRNLQSKKISNDQELIQSDPISCPQNQMGND